MPVKRPVRRPVDITAMMPGPVRFWAGRLFTTGFAQVVVEASIFARNILVAQCLGAQTLGQFVLLTLGLRLLVMSTDLATDRYIIRVQPKSLGAALSAANRLCQLRAALLGVLLVVAAILAPFGIDPLSYGLLAVAVGVRGFTHQGYRTAQRDLRFAASAAVDVGAALAGLLAIGVAVVLSLSLMRGYALPLICGALVVQAAVHVWMSHAVAPKSQPYCISENWASTMPLLQFGWPLLVSGAVMFWGMQGERVILAAIMPADQFAHISMLLQLALVPALVIGRISLSLGLPLLSASANSQPDCSRTFLQFAGSVACAALVTSAAFIWLANPVLATAFGSDFVAASTLLYLAACMQCMRLLRIPHSVAAQAEGRTQVPLVANLVRTAAVPVMMGLAAYGYGVTAVLAIATIAELLSLIIQAIWFHGVRLNMHAPGPGVHTRAPSPLPSLSPSPSQVSSPSPLSKPMEVTP